MKKRNYICLLIVFNLITLSVWAQDPVRQRDLGKMGGIQSRPNRAESKGGNGSSILDDSTKQLYGPSTTRYIFEKNIKYQTDTLKSVDTTLVDFHLIFDPVERSGYMLHDLGNIGTAMEPIFFKSPEMIGSRIGVDAYNAYFINPDSIKFYNTLSPYSWFTVVWGGSGRSLTQAGYTRNVSERWNIGGDFKGYYVDKQFQRERRGDRNAESISYDFYTWYLSKDFNYKLVASLSRTNHQVNEFGGIDAEFTDPIADFFSQTAGLRLNTAESNAYKNRLHAYQSYRLNPLLNIFHGLEWGKQIHRISITPSSENSATFDVAPFIDRSGSDAIDQTRLYDISNSIGIEGHQKRWYYSVGYMHRWYHIDYKWLNADSLGIQNKGNESYALIEGGWKPAEKIALDFSGQLMENGRHKFDAELKLPLLEVSFASVKWKPSYMQTAYLGFYDYWIKSFDDPSELSLSGNLKIKTDHIFFAPGVQLQRINHLIYFNEEVAVPGEQTIIPKQLTDDALVFAPFVKTSYSFGKWKTSVQLRYTEINSEAIYALPLPKWHFNGKIELHNLYFNNNLELQTGLMVHWKSDYLARGWDPLIQQFYSQNDFMINDYWLFGAFANIKLKRGLIFVKMNNLRQLMNTTGYFATPYYPGVGSVLDFGFKFNFYD